MYHGTWWDLHKEEQPEQVMAGRFIRLLPEDSDPVDWDDLDRLARKMTSAQEPTLTRRPRSIPRRTGR
jgi:hypothetical protein